MAYAPNRTSKSASETGEIPPVSEGKHRHEPPQPQSLPEFPDPGSTTGTIQVVSEGEDAARNAADSATESRHRDAPSRR